HQGRHVECGREPGLALLEQILEAQVGVLGPPEAREHAHRPEPAAVHRWVDTTREGIFPGAAKLVLGRPPRQALARVERLDRNTRQGFEPPRAPGPALRLRHDHLSAGGAPPPASGSATFPRTAA